MECYELVNPEHNDQMIKGDYCGTLGKIKWSAGTSGVKGMFQSWAGQQRGAFCAHTWVLVVIQWLKILQGPNFHLLKDECI